MFELVQALRFKLKYSKISTAFKQTFKKVIRCQSVKPSALECSELVQLYQLQSVILSLPYEWTASTPGLDVVELTRACNGSAEFRERSTPACFLDNTLS